MASLSQLLGANSGFASALTAAGLRKGLVKASDLLQPGMYDPALDWQQQNQHLGYTQGVGMTDLQGARTHESVYGGQGFYNDPTTGAQTAYSTPGGLADLALAKQRGQEDYNTRTAAVQRNYHNLAGQQMGGAETAGAGGGGALAQALQKRTANQALDQGGLDTNWRRFVQNNDEQRNTLIQGASQEQGNTDMQAQYAGAANTLANQQFGQAKTTSAQYMGNLPDLPAPSFSAGHNLNQAFGSSLAAAYNNPNRPRVPVKKFYGGVKY